MTDPVCGPDGVVLIGDLPIDVPALLRRIHDEPERRCTVEEIAAITAAAREAHRWRARHPRQCSVRLEVRFKSGVGYDSATDVAEAMCWAFRGLPGVTAVFTDEVVWRVPVSLRTCDADDMEDE